MRRIDVYDEAQLKYLHLETAGEEHCFMIAHLSCNSYTCSMEDLFKSDVNRDLLLETNPIKW